MNQSDKMCCPDSLLVQTASLVNMCLLDAADSCADTYEASAHCLALFTDLIAFVQVKSDGTHKVLGKGVNAQILVWGSHIFPGTFVKVGFQKHIIPEAEMIASMRHPGVVQVFGVISKADVKPGPKQLGYMVLERLGPSILGFMLNWSVHTFLFTLNSAMFSQPRLTPHRFSTCARKCFPYLCDCMFAMLGPG